MLNEERVSAVRAAYSGLAGPRIAMVLTHPDFPLKYLYAHVRAISGPALTDAQIDDLLSRHFTEPLLMTDEVIRGAFAYIVANHAEAMFVDASKGEHRLTALECYDLIRGHAASFDRSLYRRRPFAPDDAQEGKNESKAFR